MVSFPPVSPPRPYTTPSPPPYAPHALPISFFSILSPAQYWVRNTDHLANGTLHCYILRFLRNHHQAIHNNFKNLTHWRVTKKLQSWSVANIFFKLRNDDPLRVETRKTAGWNLWNWILFDRIACTAVLFTLLLAVRQRNLKRCRKSRHVSCHSTVMMWSWEVWSM